MVGGEADDVAGGRGHGSELRDDGLLFGDFAQLFVDRFAAGRRAAGAVDEDDHASDVFGVADLAQHLEFGAIFP